ncbi:hypothetical protein, partial [Agrobacterium pusense]|uniref:hypothetical protein n=1 Tax=Agrobacterium pusense TaxID=648995 RepID=UPI001AECA4A3
RGAYALELQAPRPRLTAYNQTIEDELHLQLRHKRSPNPLDTIARRLLHYGTVIEGHLEMVAVYLSDCSLITAFFGNHLSP